MSAPVVILRETDSVWHAMDRFAVSGLHHLVVLDKQNNFLGILEDRQLLALCLPLQTIGVRQRSVGQVLTELTGSARSGQQVSAAVSVQIAAAIMVRQRVDALAVVDTRGRVSGVVTMSDLMRALIGGHLEIPDQSSSTPARA